MKGKREHRVPLSDGACDVLRRMAKVKESDVVFPGEPKSGPSPRPLVRAPEIDIVQPRWGEPHARIAL